MRSSRQVRNARRNRMITQINFVPFTDVVLVLLVIFMMTASFLGPTPSLDLRLPAAASSQAPETAPKGVVVSILSDGRLYVDEESVPEADLVRRLAAHAARKETRLVVIRADRASAYERVAHAIDASKLAGLTDLALATELDLGNAPARPAQPLVEER